MVLRLVPLSAIPDSERRPIRQTRRKARDWCFPLVPRISGNLLPHELADRAARWIAPWEKWEYPGLRRLLVGALGGSLTWHAVNHWRRRGQVDLPAWAAVRWAEAIEARSVAGLELVRLLREHAAMMEARPAPGAHLRAWRAANEKPSGIGARGRLKGAPADSDVVDAAASEPVKLE